MSEKTIVTMKVKFVNGDEEHYEFRRQVEDEIQLTKRLQEALEAKFLLIELENKVQIIPFNNVLSIEVSPPPVKFPPICIKGASLV